MLIQDKSILNLLPIRRDPRTISKIANGYINAHDEGLEDLVLLEGNIFLYVTKN